MEEKKWAHASRAINARVMGDHHRSLVLNLLRRHGPMCRAEVARTLGLASSALTRLMRDLIQEGLVLENGSVPSAIGRRPTMISFNPDCRTCIGVHLQRQKVDIALVNLTGALVSRQELLVTEHDTPSDVLQRTAEAIRAMREENTLGVGIAISGLVDVRVGEDVFSPVLGWRNIPLSQMIHDAVGIPVYLENDANALASAEAWYGAARGFSDFLCVMIGDGVGSGVFIHGTLYRGAIGGAGEVGHTTFDPRDSAPVCRCGERGCLEEYCTNRYLDREARGLDFPDRYALIEAARAGDRGARAVLQRMGIALGIGLRNAANILNPQAIIVGGEHMVFADLFFPATIQLIQEHSFPAGRYNPEVLPWKLGEDGFLIGAAGFVAEDFLSSPLDDERNQEWTSKYPGGITVRGGGAC